MSLDVYLTTKELQIKKPSSGIFVRENGQTKEITQEEWNLRNPGEEPLRFIQEETETNEVFSANITHNLGKMAETAGLYKALWRPHRLKEGYNIPEKNYDLEYEFETQNKVIARELIDPIRHGLHELKLNPDKFKTLNPDNGWGTYEGLVKFTEDYLNACYQYPDAEVYASR